MESYHCPLSFQLSNNHQIFSNGDITHILREITQQLHELSNWTTRCCTFLNERESTSMTHLLSTQLKQPSNVASEIELLKRNVQVIDKQYANKLVVEVAYMQCALRSEADEKISLCEQSLLKRLSDYIDEVILYNFIA